VNAALVSLAAAQRPAHPVEGGKALRGRSHWKSLRYNNRLSTDRQLGLFPMLGLWAALCATFILFAMFVNHIYWHSGQFMAALLAFALFLAVMLVFATREFADRFTAAVGPGAGWLLGVALFLIFLIYAFGTGTASFTRLGAAAAFIFLPLLLLSTARATGPGSWQDFCVVAAVWIAVKFGPSHWLWSYAGGRLAYILSVILAVNVAIAGFLVLRRSKGVGYSIGWGSRWTFHILGALIVFACIAIPLGIKLRFLVYSPHIGEWKSFLPLSLAILFFTAWPEELLFRGLLQNFLSRSSKSETQGWIAASILFGASHLTNMHFPNWRYALLAIIAGLFYGWTWQKTGSIFASAIVHACVDILWHFLFVTP
jgi:membrane protease YdiL (CAAX protease family)